MKRIFCIFLVSILLLSGCSFGNGNTKDPVAFYYLRPCSRPDEYKTYFSEGPITSEIREASGRRQDLYYLLSMYLRGPLDPTLQSPFPMGSAIVKVQQNGQELYVDLNAVTANLDDMDRTLALACLSRTCMDLTDVHTVHIEARGFDSKVLFSTTVTADSFLLEDAVPLTPVETEETQ